MNTVAKAATTRAIDSTVAAGQSKSFGRLEYDISSCSSFSASYLPENIKTDRPQEQASRWSSGSNNQTQFITLKLDRLALVSMCISLFILSFCASDFQKPLPLESITRWVVSLCVPHSSDVATFTSFRYTSAI